MIVGKNILLCNLSLTFMVGTLFVIAMILFHEMQLLVILESPLSSKAVLNHES